MIGGEGDGQPAGHAPPEPGLVPLALGSQEARALHDIWSGALLSEVVFPDPDDRIAAAVTIAAHLAARAGLRVVLLAPSVEDRAPAVVGLSEQIAHGLIACAEFYSATVRLPRGWVPTALSSDVGVTVEHRLRPVSSDAYVALDHRDGAPGLIGHIHWRRTVHVAAERRLAGFVVRTTEGLGDIPLDIAVAGAP